METKESGVPRRDLVKGAAVAGAVLGSMPLVGLKAQGGNKKLKVGLIGAGGRATGAIENHMEAVKTINDKLSLGLEVTLVAACDFEKGKAEGTARKYGCSGDKCFGGADGYQKVIAAGPDIIVTATPPLL